jgi:hypothetical protein
MGMETGNLEVGSKIRRHSFREEGLTRRLSQVECRRSRSDYKGHPIAEPRQHAGV